MGQPQQLGCRRKDCRSPSTALYEASAALKDGLRHQFKVVCHMHVWLCQLEGNSRHPMHTATCRAVRTSTGRGTASRSC
jgi:hypothetical protein